MAVLRITWFRREDLRRDLDQQLARGGIMVQAEPPAGLQYGSSVPVELRLDGGACYTFEGQVLAVTPPLGVAVTVPKPTVDALRVAMNTFTDTRDAQTLHERPDLAPAPSETPSTAPRAPKAEPGEVLQRWNSLSGPEKIHLALHGGRDERAAVLRDRNRSLHPYVLKNPQLSLDEVIAIAKNPQASPDVLKLIAERGEWFTRASVAEAFARNPKAPGDLSVRALKHVSQEALRQMAKGHGVAPNVVQAARKKVLAT
ncbi:MAG: hypothetical protein HY909_14610 [Deltaproteobacteria bacterium]|nr:hypothetical protein [Deltaproteobacteria bacterium]